MEPVKQRRKSIRLKDYDYSRDGYYFVTICTQNRESFFGNISNEKMILNDAGTMVAKWYHEMQKKFPDIKCDEHIVMPNHFHAIILNVGADLCVCPKPDTHPDASQGEHIGSPLQRSPLPTIVQWFKTMTTNEYIRGVKQHNWPPFPGKLWQRNYYERIIRDENELNRIRHYIHYNHLKWEYDQENHPTCILSRLHKGRPARMGALPCC